MFRFTIRDLLWLTVFAITALVGALWTIDGPPSDALLPAACVFVLMVVASWIIARIHSSRQKS
jgi:hypothetical protein